MPCNPIRRRLFSLAAIAIAGLAWIDRSTASDAAGNVILVYHRFGPVVADSMTVTTPVFESQLEWLAAHHYHVVPLRDLVERLGDRSARPDPHAVAITADDGHRSVFTEMFPLIQRYKVPVTLFIYPSAISNASYALTWGEVTEMEQSGLIDVQSHSFWHPNFKTEAGRLDRGAYEKFVAMQLTRSRDVIATHSTTAVDMLAWPFGIHDPDLEQAARRAGYIAGFTLERKHVEPEDDHLALPRYLVTDLDRGPRFGSIFGNRVGDK